MDRAGTKKNARKALEHEVKKEIKKSLLLSFKDQFYNISQDQKDHEQHQYDVDIDDEEEEDVVCHRKARSNLRKLGFQDRQSKDEQKDEENNPELSSAALSFR